MNTNGAAALSLTKRQREVMWMRYERGASIEQIADWLKLTRRAVLYRLQGAKQRLEAAREDGPELGAKENARQPDCRKPRIFSVSQITDISSGQVLDLDAL